MGSYSNRHSFILYGLVQIGKEDDELHRAKIHQSMVGETITMESAVASGA